MEIEKAGEMGFCFGVRRAMEIVEKAGVERSQLSTLGPIVHNQQVVDGLAERGINIARSLDDVSGDAVVITSHGAGPDVIEQAKARGIDVIDATCPFVRKAQVAARKLGEEGFLVVVFGDADHSEVQGMLGWAGKNAIATTDELQLAVWPQRLGILCQTTQKQAAFGRFISQIVSRNIGRISELRIINTICDATCKHQEAAFDLARRVNLMLVIGGRNSANTARLAEICTETGVTTYHIETAADLNPAWFQGLRRIGITAGASTPDDVIDRVLHTLKETRV